MRREYPMISVIIPVYNVEAYVVRCLNSVAAQTYPDLEIIAVDDGSTDGSGLLCDRYAEREKRLQAVHFPENRGLSAARNEGVRRAGGAYVTFVDSDDYVEPELLEKLYLSMAENNADISICGTEGIRMKTGPAAVLSPREAARCLARRGPFLWTAWGKLYPLWLVKKYPFDGRALCCEDLPFFVQALREAERISFLPERLYHYVCREDGAVNGRIDERRCTVLSVLDHVCREAKECFPEAEAAFRQVALNTDMRLALQAVEKGTEDGTTLSYLERFRDNARRHFGLKALMPAPGLRDMAGELALCASAVLFWKIAAVRRRMTRRGRGDGA